jgi:hypothetical protein
MCADLAVSEATTEYRFASANARRRPTTHSPGYPPTITITITADKRHIVNHHTHGGGKGHRGGGRAAS